jgi:chorismate mutase
MTTTTNDAPTLAELRQEIDRIDEAMHRLLMERGDIIESLIRVKRSQETGSAFRPGREAEMMRRLAARHRGILPLDTAEGIWRVIIATFTFVQSPYAVYADVSGGEAAMRDSARFHFGFTVPFVPLAGATVVIEAVAGSKGDLGMFRSDLGASGGAWWNGLADPDRPKIIARLPFIERLDHPAGTPVFVVSKPLRDGAVRERVLVAVKADLWREAARDALRRLGAQSVASAADASGLSFLVEAPGDLAHNALSDALREAGLGRVSISEVGSHADRFIFPAT